MGSLWTLIVIAGPLLLLAVIVYGWKKNRDAPKWKTRRAEHGAKELREDMAEEPDKKVDL